MGKKRKTYKEKLIADLRRKSYKIEDINTPSFELEKKNHPLNKPSYTPVAIAIQNQAQLGQNPYPYLLKDVTKTGILTASIITIQIILFLMLKNNILSIPGISY